MITYTGKEIDPLNPKAEKIEVNDIAHALSMICRANGHFKHFYSVGQHSVNCCLEAEARGCSDRVQLACLLHDGSEAYIADLIRPVKERVSGYEKCEEKLQSIIYKKYGIICLSQAEKDCIKEIDDDILLHEFLNINDVQFEKNIPKLMGNIDFSEVSRENVEKDFLMCFEKLTVSLQ